MTSSNADAYSIFTCGLSASQVTNTQPSLELAAAQVNVIVPQSLDNALTERESSNDCVSRNDWPPGRGVVDCLPPLTVADISDISKTDVCYTAF